MRTIRVMEDALRTTTPIIALHSDDQKATRALTDGIEAVAASSQDLGTHEPVGEKMKRFLTYLCPNTTWMNTLTVTAEPDAELNTITSSGQRYRAEAESLLEEKRRTEAHFSPLPKLTPTQSRMLGCALLSNVFGGIIGNQISPLAPLAGADGNVTTRREDDITPRVTPDIGGIHDAHRQGDTYPETLHGESAIFSEEEVQALQRYWLYFCPLRHQRRTPQTAKKVSAVVSLLDKIYTRKKLPQDKKQQILDPIVEIYQRLWQPERGNDHGSRVILLDVIALEIGGKSGVHRTSYQKIRQALRRKLAKWHHLHEVQRYLDATPPPFSVHITPILNEALITDYFNVPDKHAEENHVYLGSNSHYLDELIIQVCDERFRGISDYISVPPLNQTHTVMFDMSPILGRAVLVPQLFTTREIFMGAHQRYSIMQRHGIYFLPKDTDLYLRFAIEREPNITDFINMALKAQLTKLEQNDTFRLNFENAIYFRAIGLVINALKDKPQLMNVNAIIQFLRGDIEPQIVTLWGGAVPHLLALSSPLTSDVVYLSLALFEVTVFSRTQYDEAIKTFIGQHLSLFERQRLAVSTLMPKRICHSRVYIHVSNDPACFEPVLGIKYHKEYPHVLYQAFMRQITQNIDSLTYTRDEYKNQLALMWAKGMLDTVGVLAGILSLAGTGPMGAAILASIGIGAGIGEVIINRRIAESSDDGAIYHHALEQAKLGLWFIAFGSVTDIALGSHAILKKFKAYRKQHSLNRHYGKARKYSAAIPIQDTKTRGQRKFGVFHGVQPRRKGGSEDQITSIYPNNQVFNVVKKSINPRIGSAGYRIIGDNSYVHFYTKADKGRDIGGKTLLVSAHGGFLSSDMREPAVILPESLTVKLLSPHNTYLEDPSLGAVINRGKDFSAFLTIKNGRKSINYRPQTHRGWRYGVNYTPDSLENALGRRDGLQNYRHYHFERETPEHISDVLLENRWLAKNKEATLSDILVVHDRIHHLSETNTAIASVRRVIELDQEGMLVNALGKRYDTIIFSHCRVNFLRPEWLVSTYQAVFPHPFNLPGSARSARLIRSTLHRENVSMPFTQLDEDVGEIAFYPVATDKRNNGAGSPVT